MDYPFSDGLIVELGVSIGPTMERNILGQVRAHRAQAVESTGIRRTRVTRTTGEVSISNRK